MKRLALLLLLTLSVSSFAFADSIAEVDPLPFKEFKRIADKREVPIDATTKVVIRKFVKSLDPAPKEIEAVAKLFSGDAKSTSLKSLTLLLTHSNGQAVCEKMKDHSDPAIRFLAGVALSGSGNSEAAKAVYALIHDESLSSTDKRFLRTWCDGIGIRAASDDSEKILAHLTAAMSKKPKLKKGDVAPKFDTITISGRKISSDRLQGKMIVLHFWATSCGPCLGQMPFHIKALSKHRSDEVEIIFVSLDEDRDECKATVDKYKMPFNNVHDARGWGGELVRLFGVNSMPFDIIIDGNGKVVSNSIDDIDAAVTQKQKPRVIKIDNHSAN